jgi:hypothetical protein
MFMNLAAREGNRQDKSDNLFHECSSLEWSPAYAGMRRVASERARCVLQGGLNPEKNIANSCHY